MSDPGRFPSDTPGDITQVQADMLRRAGPARRAAIGLAMTMAAIKLSRQAIRRAHPDWSEQDVNLMWTKIHYGKALADRVRAYLANRCSRWMCSF